MIRVTPPFGGGAGGGVKQKNMSKVHTFPTVSELFPGFRIPFQYIGTGETPATRAIPDSLLLAWIEANITLPTSPFSVQSVSVTIGAPNISISAGRLVLGFAITGGGSGTFNVGTAPGGAEGRLTSGAESAGTDVDRPASHGSVDASDAIHDPNRPPPNPMEARIIAYLAGIDGEVGGARSVTEWVGRWWR